VDSQEKLTQTTYAWILHSYDNASLIYLFSDEIIPQVNVIVEGSEEKLKDISDLILKEANKFNKE